MIILNNIIFISGLVVDLLNVSFPYLSTCRELHKGRWVRIIPEIIYDLMGISILSQMVQLVGTKWAHTIELPCWKTRTAINTLRLV